jgi:hypothetical protein
MKYNTRLQRNLSFRKIVKHKNKTRKTNTNKRLKHKNKRHTIRFVKNKKNTRKILYGGFDEYAPIVLMIICIFAGFFAISKAIYCISFQDHSICDHVDYMALVTVPGETLRLASMVFPQAGGTNFMSKIYNLFKKNNEESMKYCMFMLLKKLKKLIKLKKLKKLESQDESTINEDILRLFKENEHYANYANIISEKYMMELINAEKYGDFKRIIREAVEQSPSKGNLDANQHNFLDGMTLLSTTIIQKNKKPTKLLGNYILHGKNNNVLSKFFSEIRRKRVSFSSFHLFKLMRSLANGNTKILEPLEPVLASTSIQGKETKGEKIEGEKIEGEEIEGLGEVAEDNIMAEQDLLTDQQALLGPGSIDPETQDDLDEKLEKNKNEINLVISNAVRNAIDNAVKNTTTDMPITSSNPNVE